MDDATPPPRPESRWQNWTDAAGREYRIRLTIGLIGRVRRDTGINLGEALAGKLAEILFGDPERIAQVLFAISQPVSGQVAPDEFAEALDGAAVELATGAMLAAVADFFRQPRTAEAARGHLKKAMERIDEATVNALTSKGSASVSAAS
jgi:hypothetical protein